ncbi:MAG: PEP-CTERM sorting domain-containing protein [Arthrospira sp. PLM2.Bin9]|nr:PEP-CTERM sorting domain-containing protein [Arthrospira sp. PLM2.Bin9]TVU52083.1 MAG: PEP-CTERM sorting domain-containing protein [Arthrospira sp. PLM2.Bin9]
MKVKFSNIATAAVLATGLVSTLAPNAMARPGNPAVCQANIFSGLFVDCQQVSGGSAGNDNASAIAALFDKEVIGNYKVDASSGQVANVFNITSTGEGVGTLNFLDSTLANSTFAFVLKGGNGYAAYLFNGISQLSNLSWSTGGPGLSHATLYVFDTPTTPGTQVPEPATLLGLVALGGMMVGQKAISRKS